MAEEAHSSNLLVSQRRSDSNLTISLHPLVLLTISDHITRHRVRGYSGNIVGGLLGQQKGRETTLEHAFECNTQIEQDGQATLQTQWFEDRLQQYKDVHKAPALDLTGWFTLCPEDGPNSSILTVHKQFLAQNESALLLAFHPSSISTSTASTNGKLPLTIYETVYENEPAKQDDSMQIDGEDTSGLKFRPIPYTIETDETEMIAVDYVAKGGSNAAAASSDVNVDDPLPAGVKERADRKGKRRADEPPGIQKAANGSTSTSILAPEEEDQIASMTTRLNSVRMLESRLSILSSYIRSLPPSNLSMPESEAPIDQVHLPHLRSIQALITRLSLLTPHSDNPTATPSSIAAPSITIPPHPTIDPLSHAQQAQANDVALSSLLSLLGQDVQTLTELGRKTALVENTKQSKGKKMMGGGGGGPGGMTFGSGFPGFGGGGVEDPVMIS